MTGIMRIAGRAAVCEKLVKCPTDKAEGSVGT